MHYMLITSIIGSVGASFILLGFMMLQFKKWDSFSHAYLFANLAGSTLLTVYAALLLSYPFIVLNGVFAIIAIKSLLQKQKV
jgi:hypothetical protein